MAGKRKLNLLKETGAHKEHKEGKSVKSPITYLILPNQFGWLGTCFAKYKFSFMGSMIMPLTLTLLQILPNAPYIKKKVMIHTMTHIIQ